MFAATAPSVAAPIALRYPAPPTKAPATVPIPVGKSWNPCPSCIPVTSVAKSLVNFPA